MPTLELAAPDIERRTLGTSVYLSSRTPLAPHPERLGDLLRRAAERAPDRAFLLEPRGVSLRSISYGQALRAAEGIAGTLIREGWAERPVLVLSDNSIDHALLMLGAFLAGVPVAPISPAYCLRSRDFERLRFVANKLRPGLVYAESRAPFHAAIDALALDAPVVSGGETKEGLWLRDFFDEPPGDRARERAIGPQSVAKILFTSGSTGRPKGVLNTHGMLTSNQQALAQAWPFLREHPPSLVDWLPWSHTFGGNHDFNLVLFHAGTLLIDDGKPTPELVGRTVANLRRLPPSLYFNVPAGFAALVPLLESDQALRDLFFSRLELVFYAGAALPNDLWRRIVALSERARGERVFMTTAWGSTETSPLATSAHFALEAAGNIGVPVAGVTLKLVPNGTKLEVRVKGPNVMPGYLDDPELSAAAFDEEGFYCIGDAVKEIDVRDPSRGLAFDGRVAEDFKLTTGTWVNVGKLRTGLLAACSPALSDLVIAGQDEDFIAVMAWPSAPGCKALGADDPVHDRRVRDHVRAAIERWNAEHPGRSTAIGRVLLLAEAASIDAGEITDKGYVNQRATLERRANEVERLYATVPDAEVLLIA
jgi:feruloyl-CoA synthase